MKENYIKKTDRIVKRENEGVRRTKNRTYDRTRSCVILEIYSGVQNFLPYV
jgi:hypothetical protein